MINKTPWPILAGDLFHGINWFNGRGRVPGRASELRKQVLGFFPSRQSKNSLLSIPLPRHAFPSGGGIAHETRSNQFITRGLPRTELAQVLVPPLQPGAFGVIVYRSSGALRHNLQHNVSSVICTRFKKKKKARVCKVGAPYVVPCEAEICFLLLPKEVDAEVFHQRGEIISDLLQNLRSRPHGFKELGVGVDQLGGEDDVRNALTEEGSIGLVSPVVRSTEEQDAICRHVY